MRNLTDPQSWSAYSYVNINPAARVDPDGRGFLTKLLNKLIWGVWGEEEDVQAEEKKRRDMMLRMQAEAPNKELIVQSPVTGDWVLLHPETMNRVNVFLWSNAISSYNGSRPLTPEQYASVIDSAPMGRPALKGDPYHPDEVAKRQAEWAPRIAEEARKEASQAGAKLIKQFKETGLGQAAGRSGGHGSPFARAGAELIRKANQMTDPVLKEAYAKEGQRLINCAKSVRHKRGLDHDRRSVLFGGV